MKQTNQDEEEFEMLLGEIPRATLAPLHLKELQRENTVPLQREDSGKFPIPQAYEEFYQGYYGVKNLSSPSFGKMVTHSPSSTGCLNTFCGRLSFDSSGGLDSTQLPKDKRFEFEAILHEHDNIEHEEKHFSLSMHENGAAFPPRHCFANDQALASAFTNITFKEDRPANQEIQVVSGSGEFSNEILDGRNSGHLSGSYSTIPVMDMSNSEPFMHASNSQSPELLPETMNHPRAQTSMLTSFHMHGVKYPITLKSNNVNTKEIATTFNQSAYGAACVNNLIGKFNDHSGVLLDHQLQFPLYSPGQNQQYDLHAQQVLSSSSRHPSTTEFRSSMFGLLPQYCADSQNGSYSELQQPPFSLLQQGNPMQFTWNKNQDGKSKGLNQAFMLLQQAQAFSGLPNHGLYTNTGIFSNVGHKLQVPMKNLHEFEQPPFIHQSNGRAMMGDFMDLVPSLAGTLNLNYPDLPLQGGNISRINSHGFCGSRESYPFSACQRQLIPSARMSGSLSVKGPRMVAVLDQHDKAKFPENILTRKETHGMNNLTTINPSSEGVEKDSLTNGHGSARSFSNWQYSSAMPLGSFMLDNQVNSKDLPSKITEFECTNGLLPNGQQAAKYNSLEEVEGQIYTIAKDQHGCRFLQKKFEEGSPHDVHQIFVEIIDHIMELMTDPFGNYLVQKLLEVSDDGQRKQILHAVTKRPCDLVNISLNMHGTRAVQRLIEMLKTAEEIFLVVTSLESGVVPLIKDLNGNHVVRRCLECLSDKDNQFLFDAAVKHCVEIAKHRHGCCVLQRCIDYSNRFQQDSLVAEIAANALKLSQDQFGNYVVQYIVDHEIPWAIEKVIAQLEGHHASLSMQKFSSNVVEKCLKHSKEEHRAAIIQELLNSSQLGQILQDAYGNYVIQSALTFSKGLVHAALVEAIRPHSPALRSCLFGRRILSRINLKK